MKTFRVLAFAAASLVFLSVGAQNAFAADVDLTGPNVYDFNNLALTDGGGSPTVYEVSGNLILRDGAVIQCNDPNLPTGASACPITIAVTGNLLMEAGSAIRADNTVNGGDAGDITITVGGDMTMCGPNGGQLGCLASADPGALISAQKMSGGAVSLVNSVTITVGDKATATGNFYMEGGVTTYGLETGARIDTSSSTGHAGNITVTAGKTYFTEPGAVVQAGFPINPPTATAQGGKIFLVSDCGLTSEGRVTSKGPDFGADLVHLESCTVLVRGLVESTGKGHAADQPNSCDNVNDGLPGEVLRDHPDEATGCIEVWGNIVTIDSSTINPATSLPWAGELNADIGNGGASGTSWIDIFALSNLTVTDGVGNDFLRDNFGHTYFSTYAVHANAMDGSDHNPSVITAKVKSGPLTASGKAFEASSTLTDETGHGATDEFVGNGSDGGTIDLQASGTVTLDDSWINASGDFGPGTPPLGGHIIVKAWGTGSDVLWREIDGNIQPIATGTIVLNACDVIDTTGTDFHGEVPATSTGGANCDASEPTIPTITAANAGPVFKTNLWALCSDSSISGIKFSDLNGNGVKDAGEPGLNGWVIHIFNATKTVHQTFTTAGAGNYSFTGLPAGTYTICEQLQPGWQQTSPVAGVGVVNCAATVDTPVDNPTPGPLGYTVVTGDCCSGGTCTGTPITGKDFGNIQLATKSGVKWHDVNANNVRNLPDDVGLNGWVIHLFGFAVNGTPVHETRTTAGGGVYSFTVLPGTYLVCEQLQPNWGQTFPTSGAPCLAGLDPAGDNPTPGLRGYAIVLTPGEVETGNDFGNATAGGRSPDEPFCKEDEPRSLLLTRTVYTGSPGPNLPPFAGVPNYTTFTAAYDAAQASPNTVNEVIGLFSKLPNEDAVLDYYTAKSMTITQCTSASQRSWTLTANKKLLIIGPDSTGSNPSGAGWDLATGGHELKSIRSNGASTFGVRIRSGANSNAISFNKVTSSGIGVEVLSNSNTLKAGTIGPNTGAGIHIGAGTTGNNVSGITIQNNGNNGVLVEDNTNKIESNKLNANSPNGIKVTGNTNTIQSNQSDSNTGDGYNIAGTGNIVKDNKANTNSGDGFDLSGSGQKLTGSQSSGGVDYRVSAPAAVSAPSGNKADGTSIPAAGKCPTIFSAGGSCS